MCGYKPDDPGLLDAHHITDRHYMPNGGYCAANGITLCTDRCGRPVLDCHQKAESLHAVGVPVSGYTPTDLYARIKTSHKWAYEQSLKLAMPEAEANAIMRSIDRISKEEMEICLTLCVLPSVETWEITCDELNECDPLARAYAKGRYVADE